MKVFLTGATGYVGTALWKSLANADVELSVLVRQRLDIIPFVAEQVVADLTSFSGDLSCVDVVIHAAARAHIMHDKSQNPLREFRKINRDATLSLARLAADSGVSRFVFLSSIGVNGNVSLKPFTEKDNVNPHDAYSLSKYEAEQGLLAIAKETGMEVVIIRPPLVYGANAPGNFGRLVEWVRMGVPLPLGAVNNRRSLIALDNLVDFVTLCADRARSPKAINEVFVISDNEDVSTTELLRKVADAQGTTARLIPIPVRLMKFAANSIGKESLSIRLFGDLQVDSSKARALLGWRPVVTMQQALDNMFMDAHK